jgi:hypothetical protein
MGTPTIEDRMAIIDVTIAYCWALDTHEWAALDDVFLPDATAELGSMCNGLDSIKERVSRVLVPLDDSQHVVSTHQISVDGDTATCRCYLLAQHVRNGVPGGDNLMVGGRYEDTLVRTASGWRISHRKLVTMWREGNPEVVRPR